jgi:hypothetical protein
MQWLLLLSRIGFICNLLFLVAVLNRFTGFMQSPDLIGTVVILGYGAVFLNIVLILVYILLALQKRLRGKLPYWLAAANTLFLIVQVIYFT